MGPYYTVVVRLTVEPWARKFSQGIGLLLVLVLTPVKSGGAVGFSMGFRQVAFKDVFTIMAGVSHFCCKSCHSHLHTSKGHSALLFCGRPNHSGEKKVAMARGCPWANF